VSAIPNRRIEGKYEILEKLREGGMGAIYKVRHRLLDEVRVIKLMRSQLGEDPEFKARFTREARVAIKLRHPNIAHLYDFTLGDDDTAFIVMEFIDGRTLEELLKAVGPPPLGLALEVAQQSLRALGYLHSKGFVHRDISPDNLMLAEDPDGNPQVKLIDLGITKVLEGPDAHLTKTGTFLGKLRYASPEQFGAAGAPSADARGDLYSFGVVLYELLTGVHPILGSDPSSIIAGHLFRPPLPFDETDRNGRLPAGLRAAVSRALAKSPDERYANARDFAQQLAAFRQPGDLLQGEWQRLIEQPASAAVPGATSSTQHRLDEHFAPTTTPTPSLLIEVARVPAGGAAAAAVAGTAGAPAGPDAPGAASASVAPATSIVPDVADVPDVPPPAAASAIQAAPGAPGTAGGGAAAAPAADIAPLLADARRLAARENLREAGKLLRRADRLAPGNAEVRQLRDEIGQASRRHVEARRRAGQAESQAAEIRRRLDRGDLEGGAALLAEAAAELGESTEWQQLAARLDVLRGEMRLAKVGALLMRARQLWSNGDLDQAILAAAEARAIEPDNPAVQALAGELDAAVAQRDKDRRRAGQLEQTVAAVGAKLDAGELEEASKLLDWAVVRFGAAPTLREQWEQLEERKRQALAARVEEVLAEARRLAAAGNPAAARGAVEEARTLADKVPELRTRVAEADAVLARHADRRRAEELLRDARLLVKVEDHEDAARKLAKVLELAPGHAAAQALLEQVRAALKRPAPGGEGRAT
jgi:serine/threonine protein kinase